MVALFRLFCLVVRQIMMRERTLIPCLSSRFVFMELTFGRMRKLTRRWRASTFHIVSTRCRRMIPGLPALGYFFSLTLRPRVVDGSEGVAAFGFSFCCARSLLSCRKLHWFPFKHWPFLSTDNKYLFSPSTPLNPFRFLTTAPVSIFPCLASKFRNRNF